MEEITLYAQDVLKEAIGLLNREIGAARLSALEITLAKERTLDVAERSHVLLKKTQSILRSTVLFTKLVLRYTDFLDSYVSKCAEIDLKDARARLESMGKKLKKEDIAEIIETIKDYNSAARQENSLKHLQEKADRIRKFGIDISYQRIFPSEIPSILQSKIDFLLNTYALLNDIEYDLLNNETKRRLSEIFNEVKQHLPVDLISSGDFKHLIYCHYVPELKPNPESDPIDDLVLLAGMGLSGQQKTAEVKKIKVKSASRPNLTHYVAERKDLKTGRSVFACSCEDYRFRHNEEPDYHCRHIDDIIKTK